jgi:hypothetical protein
VSPVVVVALLALAQAWLCIRLAPFLVYVFLISFSAGTAWPLFRSVRNAGRRWPVRFGSVALVALITVGPGWLGGTWLASIGVPQARAVAAIVTLGAVVSTLAFVYGVGFRANLPRLLRPALCVACTATAGLTALSWAEAGSTAWLGGLAGAGVVAVATLVVRIIAPRLDRARLMAGLRQHLPRFRDTLVTLHTPPWRLAACAGRPGQLSLTYQHGRTAAAAIVTLQEDVTAPAPPGTVRALLPTPGLPDRDGAYLEARGLGSQLHLRLSPSVVARVHEINPGALDWAEVAASLRPSDEAALLDQALLGSA